MQFVTRFFIAITACVVFTAAGCGQTGVLYLPDETRETVPADESADTPDDQQ